MKIHHVGYLVKKIDKAKAALERLGYTLVKEVINDEYRKVDICFLEKGGYVIELVSPNASDSVVADLIKKMGNTPYHICYETDCFEQDLEFLQNEKYVLCSEKHEAVALDGRNVCFLIHPYLGMIELLEGVRDGIYND